MNVSIALEGEKFLKIMREGLEEGSITTEEILTELAFYHGDVFVDEVLAVNSCMKVLEAL